MNDTTPPAVDPARRRVEQEVADRVAAEHAAADMAHRDDLARDVAREWAEWQVQPSDRDRVSLPSVELQAALDRLSAAYGEQQEG